MIIKTPIFTALNLFSNTVVFTAILLKKHSTLQKQTHKKMNSKKESKLKMYLTVRVFLLQNPEITDKLPNFTEFMTNLNAAILQIQSNSEQHQFNSKGVAGNKKELKTSLISSITDCSRKMQAYAKYENDTVLMAETRFLESYLKPLSEIELLNSANGLHSRINSHIASVTMYDLTAATQTEFRLGITAYEEAIPQTRQSQLGKKENTLLEIQGFELGDVAYSNIDSVVNIVKLTEPTFYAGYKNARKVVEYGVNTLQVQGQITDIATQLPILDATLIFILSGQTEVAIQKQTAAKGGYMIKSLAEGMYDVTISKVGYQTQTVSATVSFTELCDVSAGMVKI